MYKIGELIQYGGTGVCRISEIKNQTLPGSDEQRLYYVLQPLYKACVISVPVDSDKVPIRPIISRQEADRLISQIPQREPKPFHSRASRELAEHYGALLRSNSCDSWIDLTVSIHSKKQKVQAQKRKIGSVDERFLKQAEEMLFGELAAALEIPKDQVREYISAKLEEQKAG